MVPGKKIMGADPLIHPTADLKGVKTKKKYRSKPKWSERIGIFLSVLMWF